MRAFNEADQSVGSRRPRSADIHPGPGFRVRTSVPRLPPEVVLGFAEFATPEISDLLNRLYALDSGIVRMSGPDRPLSGVACTVRVYPGDNLMVHKSLDVAAPGDVVVVAASGTLSNAVLGDIISTKARHRGIGGFVVDGLVRDLPSIQALDFPVYARGTTPIGPLHRGPGEINYPVACGGVVVNPGDVVVADGAGVVIVPQQIAVDLLQRLRAHAEGLAVYLAAVQRGEFDNSWVDTHLHGCEVDPADELRVPSATSTAVGAVR
ncbi:RraA family protein [Pseudonocardia nigra]|uniref:RraA family protein n=1 Tax=Pseudonocardia nigra TaxID=1921578 RepID=UPI001C5FEDF3|nr:RraA family protein [Pseudonocardia nigra]